MKNFIFISPNFPEAYWRFCAELKKNGLRVLGIGDCPYDALLPELRDALHEYYKVGSLENYDEVFRAVAFFTFKYGKIDWLESNNEYWLTQDAKLRTEFHITSGFMVGDMDRVKRKSGMKAYYAKAGLSAARFRLDPGLTDALEFAHTVGYPVVAKPDNGVGTNNTYKLRCDEDVQAFFRSKDNTAYIMEEFVRGHVETYDAIIDSHGAPIYEAGNVTPHSLIEVVNNQEECLYYIGKDIAPKIRDAGLRTVDAFGVRSRFVHLEFFVLDEAQGGLGEPGDVLGLEVNMRPSGGFTPDMYNFAHETDVYKIWADMIAFDRCTLPLNRPRHYCAFIGRRDGRNYVLDHEAALKKYGYCMKMQARMPDALSGCMANQVYLCNFDSEQALQAFYRDMLAQK